jgi:hypothetical protein
MTGLLILVIALGGFAAQSVAEEMSLPSKIAPRITVASAAEAPAGTVFLHLIVMRTVPEERIRKIVRDGKEVEENYTVHKPVFESHAPIVGNEKPIVFNRDGKEVEPKEVLQRLKNPTPVAITEDGKLDPFYKPMFREDVLVIAIPSGGDERLGAPLQPLQAMPAAPMRRIMPTPANK